MEMNTTVVFFFLIFFLIRFYTLLVDTIHASNYAEIVCAYNGTDCMHIQQSMKILIARSIDHRCFSAPRSSTCIQATRIVYLQILNWIHNRGDSFHILLIRYTKLIAYHLRFLKHRKTLP